jgi:hypothetical protein
MTIGDICQTDGAEFWNTSKDLSTMYRRRIITKIGRSQCERTRTVAASAISARMYLLCTFTWIWIPRRRFGLFKVEKDVSVNNNGAIVLPRCAAALDVNKTTAVQYWI